MLPPYIRIMAIKDILAQLRSRNERVMRWGGRKKSALVWIPGESAASSDAICQIKSSAASGERISEEMDALQDAICCIKSSAASYEWISEKMDALQDAIYQIKSAEASP